MTAPKSKRGKTPQLLVVSTSDILQLNGTSFLPDPLLDEVVKVGLYNSCKNAAIFVLLAQAAVGTDEDHYIKTENAVPIDCT